MTVWTMFDTLSDKLGAAVKSLSGRGRITEANVREAMAEVRTALIEADVNLEVVDSFCDEVLADAIGRASAAGMLRAEHLVHLRCEVSAADALTGFERMKTRPEVRLVSVMDHTPGQRQFVSMDAYRTYYMGKSGMTAAELEDYIAMRQEQHRRYAADHRRGIVAGVRDRGIALASHDDATEDHVAEAVADGLLADAVSALTNLGYGRSDAFRAVAAERDAQGEAAALDALIRGSLKRLSAQ